MNVISLPKTKFLGVKMFKFFCTYSWICQAAFYYLFESQTFYVIPHPLTLPGWNT
jgi:hypothetical protein